MADEPNEFSPRDRGLLIGHTWAKAYTGDVADLRSTADGEIRPELRAEIEAFLRTTDDDIENPTAFWTGFVVGVRALIVERERSGYVD